VNADGRARLVVALVVTVLIIVALLLSVRGMP
jgi:hypothetical protein